jgi:hypothetical protein
MRSVAFATPAVSNVIAVQFFGRALFEKGANAKPQKLDDLAPGAQS